jgi:hypothetical protein
MKRWDKNGRVWYSHKVDGKWCSGKYYTLFAKITPVSCNRFNSCAGISNPRAASIKAALFTIFMEINCMKNINLTNEQIAVIHHPIGKHI